MTRSVGDLRPSQLITTFGPGSIVDLPRLSALVCGLDAWTVREDLRIAEPRLCAALGVRGLYEPLVDEGPRGPRGTIPARVFPRFLVCAVCRLLAPAEGFRWDHRWAEFRCADPRCRSRGEVRVLPSRFVVACERGHLDDFPFHDYVHGGGAGACGGPLRLLDSGATGAIADIGVKCLSSGDYRTLAPAFGDGPGVLGRCTRRRPWLGADDVDPRECAAEPKALLRGASNLYFPIVRSALSLPEWAHPIHDDLARYEQQFAKVNTRDDLEILLRIGNYPELAAYTVDELFDALMGHRQPVPRLDAATLLEPEWQALRHPTRAAGPAHFETEDAGIPEGFEDVIEQAVLVHRLKEVRAIQAFTRIEPPGSWGDEPDDPERVAPLSRADPEWLPAVVVRGEGIFIELRHDAVARWVERDIVARQVGRMTEALTAWREARGLTAGPEVDPRYVLTHSLAHVLIRRASLDAGYSASSLRERIYGSSHTGMEMNGLLIYTASTDSDGSLGGLVDLGRARRLRPLLTHALEEALLCSSDPLCADNEPRAKGLLNGAACHACLLASETSCERGNRLLDRAALVETLAGKGAGFFQVT